MLITVFSAGLPTFISYQNPKNVSHYNFEILSYYEACAGGYGFRELWMNDLREIHVSVNFCRSFYIAFSTGFHKHFH